MRLAWFWRWKELSAECGSYRTGSPFYSDDEWCHQKWGDGISGTYFSDSCGFAKWGFVFKAVPVYSKKCCEQYGAACFKPEKIEYFNQKAYRPADKK